MTPTPLDQVLVQKARGRFRTALRRLNRLDATLPTSMRAACQTADAELRQLTGDGEAAASSARRVLRSANAALECRARCHAVLGAVAAEQGKAGRSLNRFRRALEDAEAAGDAELVSRICLDAVGHLGDVVGPPVAGRLVDECVRAATVAAQPDLHVRLHLALAGLDLRRGCLDPALAHLGAAEELLATGENPWLAGRLALARADACALGADCAAEARYGRAALGHALRSGHLASRTEAIACLARAGLAAGNAGEAETLCEQGLALPGGSIRVRIALLDTLARIGLYRARPEECRRRLAELDDLLQRDTSLAPAPEVLASCLTRARLALVSGAWHEALAVCETGIASADECGDLPRSLSLRCLKADACRGLGRVDLAARTLAEARDLTDDVPLPLTAELERAHTSLLGAAELGDRERPAVEASLRILWAVGTADARRDGVLGYLQSAGRGGARPPGRLADSPCDVTPIVRDTLPGRTSTPIPTRGPASIPDLLDLAPLAHLASRPELLAQELFILLRRSGWAVALAMVFTRDGRSFDLRAHEGWSAAEAAAAAHRPGRATSIPCGMGTEGEVLILVRPPEDVRARAGLPALRSHVQRLAAFEAFRQADRDRPSPWPPELRAPGDDGVFASPAMRRLVEKARKVAASTLPILILGESGTGKEVLARLIHRHSGRGPGNFVPFNCTGTPRDLVDSQLFGHLRGSFTGAYDSMPGLVRTADGGTLLLDEVGELDLQAQPKLLRLLEHNEVQPLGAARPVAVDVRVIAATNADLAGLVREGRFREDLLFRLNAVCLPIPPLRERRDDIPPLVHYFLRRHGAEQGRPRLKLSARTLRCLLRYRWPGNVRQLSNEIRRAAALADDGAVITPEHLSAEVLRAAQAEPAGPRAAAEASPFQVTLHPGQTLAAATAAVERALIRRALEVTGGRVDPAARLLGLSRKGLFLKRRRHGADLPVA